MTRVEICGGIASGKTTLAKLLRAASLHPVLEDFRRNPFLTDFYADPAGFAFETELSFILQHYHALQKSRASSQVVCDFSFYLDLAYANFTLRKRDRIHFRHLYEILVRRLGRPRALIRLECPEEEELRRIRARGRGRENAISLDYLAGLDKALRRTVNSISNVRVLTVNSYHLNYARIPEHRSLVVSMVRKFLN